MGDVIQFPDIETRIEQAQEAVKYAMVHRIEDLPTAIFKLADLLRARDCAEGVK